LLAAAAAASEEAERNGMTDAELEDILREAHDERRD
jgi:hypothetical protein